MIVSMRQHATREEIDHVCERIREFGYKVHSIEGEERVVIGIVGVGDVTACLESLEAMPQVEKAVRISAPYKFVSREFRSAKTEIDVRGAIIGGDEFIVMAGPCSVESEKQILESAEIVARSGAQLLRGGAFKPRTSPYAFQGLAEKGLELLALAREETGLAVVTEVMAVEQVKLVEKYADVLQVGARNMQNFNLLNAVGEANKPVLLKRGLSATLEEFLLAAEYIMSKGNGQVMLCERGIRTYEDYVRNTLALAAVPALHRATHLPVVVDPSQGTGKNYLVDSMCRAAVAAGADGLIIEVHNDPEHALTDGAQSITHQQFGEMMKAIRRIAAAVDREA